MDEVPEMIVFDLQCKNGHTFEGWFDDNAAYEKQQGKGLIACPVCNSSQVVKLPSAFTIKNQSTPSKPPEKPSAADLERMGQQLAKYLDKHFDNVGPDFAKEALKIHYGVSEPRNIRGVSTPQEEETLRQEGIQFLKLALPPSSSSSSSSSSSDSDI